jgi:hypothetical protein
VPDATTVKVAVWPAVTLWLVGAAVIAGAVEGGDELPVVLLVVPVVVPAQPAATQTTKKQRAHVRRRFIMEAPSRLLRDIPTATRDPNAAHNNPGSAKKFQIIFWGVDLP